MTIDLAVDPVTGDLAFDGVTVAVVEGKDAIAQEIQTRLRWWRGEWFLDTSAGVPYLESILTKGVAEATVRAILLREILAVPGVLRVPSLVVAIDRATRYATVAAADIETTDGAVTLSQIGVGA